jgi:hypothetical protein
MTIFEIPTATRELLSTEKGYREARTDSRKYAVIVLLILNLFLDAYLEEYLRNDPGGVYLTVFLYLKSGAIVLLFLPAYFTTTDKILFRTGHYPLSCYERLSFITISGFRRPEILGLVVTDTLFFVVTYCKDVSAVIAVALSLAVLAAALQALLTAALLVLRRTSQPITVLAGLCGVGFFIVGFSALIFRAELISTVIPLIAWARTGILAAAAGDSLYALANVGFLAIVWVGATAIAYRNC